MVRLSGQDHVHHAGDPVQIRRRDRINRFLDFRLHVGIQRGLDQVSALGDLFLAQPRSGQELLNVVAEESPIPGRDAPARQLVGSCQDAQRLLFGGAELVSLAWHVFDHGVEDQVAPYQRTVGVGVRVKGAGRLH